MSTDRAGILIDRLIHLRDPAFAPPPFSANVAEAVLGPSGRLLTPHRRLLERANGAYLHEHALHLFGACESPAWHSLRAWNDRATWRDTYGDATDGLTFFAEDAFGDQFAYTGSGGEVVTFEAELGRIVPAAPSFVAWLEEMIERPAALLPVDVLARERSEHRMHAAGTHLYSWPPLFSVESREGVSLGHVDAIEAMRFRGELARQIRNLPPGTQFRLDLPGIPDASPAPEGPPGRSGDASGEGSPGGSSGGSSGPSDRGGGELE